MFIRHTKGTGTIVKQIDEDRWNEECSKHAPVQWEMATATSNTQNGVGIMKQEAEVS
jgi:hypothetical protein